MVRVKTDSGFRINCYVTHLIARYDLDRDVDPFDAHRHSQLIELMQFVNLTSPGADAILMAGDFNMASNTVGYDLLRNYLGASDTWVDQTDRPSSIPLIDWELDGCTCDRADNPYRNDEWTKTYGNGERLDYLFYRAGPGPFDDHVNTSNVSLTCTSSRLDFRQIPDSSLHYSDHVGVVGTFNLSKSSFDQVRAPVEFDSLVSSFEHLDARLERGIAISRRSRHRMFVQSLIVVGLIVLALALSTSTNGSRIASCLSILTGVILGFLLFTLLASSIIVRRCELRGLVNTRTVVGFMLNAVKGRRLDSSVESQ